MRWRATSRLLVLGACVGGCAYYNGLYNANRLANDAARARREGRAGQARSMWQEAAIKAESVATRYPRSKYRDDALLLQGRALREADQCDRAVTPLSLVTDSSPDPVARRRATLLLGECRVLLGDPQLARATLGQLVDDTDRELAASARVWRARAALAQADYAGALHDLTGVADTSAAFDRASALIGLGNIPDAAATLAILPPGAYDERRWPAVLDEIGGVDPRAAGTLVDSLIRRGNLTRGQNARLLLADAVRWQRVGDDGRAAGRFAEARQAAPDSTEGRIAAVQLVALEVRQLRDPSRLGEMVMRLRQATQDGGQAATIAERVLSALVPVAEPATGHAADIRLFIAIEGIRDSLYARPLAAALFTKFQRDNPGSAVAAKALLAAAFLEPDSAAALTSMVARLYPDSPYRIAAQTGDAAAFTAFEDSLRALLGDEEISRPVRPARPGDPSRPTPPSGRRLPEP